MQESSKGCYCHLTHELEPGEGHVTVRSALCKPERFEMQQNISKRLDIAMEHWERYRPVVSYSMESMVEGSCSNCSGKSRVEFLYLFTGKFSKLQRRGQHVCDIKISHQHCTLCATSSTVCFPIFIIIASNDSGEGRFAKKRHHVDHTAISNGTSLYS